MVLTGLEVPEEEAPEVLPVEEKEGWSGWAKAGAGATVTGLAYLLYTKGGMSKNQAKKLTQ